MAGFAVKIKKTVTSFNVIFRQADFFEPTNAALPAGILMLSPVILFPALLVMRLNYGIPLKSLNLSLGHFVSNRLIS